MFFTPFLSAITREDRRPLYRRIFTNRRLDIAHKIAVRSIIGFIIFSSTFCVVNGTLYFIYQRPIRRRQIEELQKELIEADTAGFAVKP